MKNLIRVIFILSFTVFFAGCDLSFSRKNNPSNKGTETENKTLPPAQQNGNNSGTETEPPKNTGSGTGSETPKQDNKTPNPGTAAQDENSISVDAAALLAKHNIERGHFTASKTAAILAEKINTENFNGILFKNVKIISYDDEKGSFAIEAELSKNNVSAVKQFMFENFTHPLKDSHLATVVLPELNLDAGMEENLPLDEFIKKANEENGKNINNFLKKDWFLCCKITAPK